MGLKIILGQAEKNLLKEVYGEDIMERTSGQIGDLVDEAINGQEALDAVIKAHKNKHFQYGIIFMDCSMPIMDGYDATEEIRRY